MADGSTGARGSLADPEIYENVPGHVIPIIEREFDDFDTEAAGFLAGRTPEDQFIGFRLKQGVYGQRPGRAPDDPRQAPLRRYRP